MNGLEAILGRIMAEAEETVRGIHEQSDANCDELLAAAGREAVKIAAAEKKKAEEQAAALIRRTESLAALETRKTILTFRQALIEEVINKAARQLASLPDDDKSVLFRRLLTENATGSESVIFATGDRHLADQILIDVNQASGWNLTIDPEIGDFDTGLVLRQGPIQMNLSIGLLIRNLHPELVSLAAKVLFDG